MGTLGFNGLSNRTNREMAWRLIQLRSLGNGFNPRLLGRVDDYLSTVCELQTPSYTDLLQRPAHYFPGLTAKPFHEPAELDGTERLERASNAIRDEFLNIRSSPRFRPHPQKLAEPGQWGAFHFYAYGHRIDRNHEACPETSKVIDSIAGTAGAGIVYFSALRDGTRVKAHCGVTNTRLRCQLGLFAEEGCGIRVGSETRSWEAGKCIVFDDSFEHEAWNFSGSERVVLIVDFWHPELTEWERLAIRQINSLAGRYRKYRKQVRNGLKAAARP